MPKSDWHYSEEPEHPKHEGTSLEGAEWRRASNFFRERNRFTVLVQLAAPSSSYLLCSLHKLVTFFGALEGCVEAGPHPGHVCIRNTSSGWQSVFIILLNDLFLKKHFQTS